MAHRRSGSTAQGLKGTTAQRRSGTMAKSSSTSTLTLTLTSTFYPLRLYAFTPPVLYKIFI